MKVAIDADIAGVSLKHILVEDLRSMGIEVDDLNHAGSRAEGIDYPDIAFNLARRIGDKTYERGILICGTGLGMAMCACKVPGVYAGTCHDVYSAERLRKSNDAQIITLGERVIGPELAKMIVRAWLAAEFAGGGSLPKVERMHELEAGILKAGHLTSEGGIDAAPHQ